MQMPPNGLSAESRRYLIQYKSVGGYEGCAFLPLPTGKRCGHTVNVNVSLFMPISFPRVKMPAEVSIRHADKLVDIKMCRYADEGKKVCA